jgi:hypothetical protein
MISCYNPPESENNRMLKPGFSGSLKARKPDHPKRFHAITQTQDVLTNRRGAPDLTPNG